MQADNANLLKLITKGHRIQGLITLWLPGTLLPVQIKKGKNNTHKKRKILFPWKKQKGNETKTKNVDRSGLLKVDKHTHIQPIQSF